MKCVSPTLVVRSYVVALALLVALPGLLLADGVTDRQTQYLNDYYNSYRNNSTLGSDADTTIDVAFTGILLNKTEDYGLINTALSDYFTGKGTYWDTASGDPASIDGYWASRTIAAALMDDRVRPHITTDNQNKMKAYLFNLAQNRDKLEKTSLDAGLRGRIYDSGNHDMHGRMVYWATAQILKDDPVYKNQVVTGGQTVEQRYGEWTTNLLDYFQDRAGKGGTVEVDSTVYAATYHSPVFNVAEYAEDARLKQVSRDYLTLHMTDLAQKSTEGITGGAKSRAGKNRVQTPGEHRSIQYLWLFTGDPAEGMNGVVPGGAQLGRILGGATTTDYRLPQQVVDMVLDEDSRGTYTYTTNRMGEGSGGNFDGRPVYTPSEGQSNLLHTTRVTPDFTLGWFTANENENYMAISGQSQAMFAITDASPTSRLVMNITGGKRNNELQAVGDGNAMIFRRQFGRYAGDTPRVYVADDFTYSQDASGWVFGTDASGSYFAFKGVLPSDGSTVGYTLVDPNAIGDGGPGDYVTFNDDDTFVILQMGQASEYASFQAFKDDIIDNALTANGGTVTYNPGAAGGELTMFNSRALPQVNGVNVDLTPAKVYDSPYLNADYGSTVIQVTDLQGNTFDLDFNYDPVAPTMQVEVAANATISDVFSPGYREMVGVTEVSTASGSLNYQMEDSSTLQIDFDGYHNVMDTLMVNGNFHMDGTLLVNMIRDTPTRSGVHQVIDADSLSGSFDTVTLPTLGNGLFWNTDQLETQGILQLMQASSLRYDTGTPALDSDFRADVAAISANFTFLDLDEGGRNNVRAMTFYFDPLDPELVESVVIQARVQGLSGYENDGVRLDAAGNNRAIASMDGYVTGGGFMTLTYELTPEEFAMMADGQLNLAFMDDILVDWVEVTWVTAVPEPSTVVLLGLGATLMLRRTSRRR